MEIDKKALCNILSVEKKGAEKIILEGNAWKMNNGNNQR
jgi:Holliday junction resolvasome RuvABC DNA-binding subunit